MGSGINLEAQLWAFVHSLGPCLWYAKSGLAFVCFVSLFFESWKVSRLMLALRSLTMLGMLMIFYSAWSNTALGPLGDIWFWSFYALYRVGIVWRLLPAIRAQMALQPPMPESLIWSYIKARGRIQALPIQRVSGRMVGK